MALCGRMTEIRRYRTILQRSQREFAEQLGVTIETYRTWDAGRRAHQTTSSGPRAR